MAAAKSMAKYNGDINQRHGNMAAAGGTNGAGEKAQQAAYQNAGESMAASKNKRK